MYLVSNMKLPIPKDECGKRMMTMSETSTGRKSLICERRETSLAGGHAIRGVQLKGNMDLGSGDTSDYYPDIQSNYDSIIWDTRYELHDFQPAQSTIAKIQTTSSTSTPPQPSPPPLTPPISGKPFSSSSESVNRQEQQDEERSDAESLFKGKENQSGEAKKATLAVVEDSKQSFTANESNPTVPAPTEPSKTSTLRLSDRTQSESEDDIEKMDDPEQDGTIIGHKTLYKTTATTDNSPNSEKTDKNGNRSDLDQNEADDDCVVQCLSYTIQCCECVIF